MKRVITGLIFSAIASICILMGEFALALFIGALCFLGMKEYVHFNELKGFKPSLTYMYAFGFLIFFTALLHRYDLMIAIVSMGTIVAFLTVMARDKGTIADTATSILGVLYGMLLPAHIILLRGLDYEGFKFFGHSFSDSNSIFQLNDGLGYVFLIFWVIIATDVGGFYIGTKFGKTPLAPELSPKKTIEGSVGGTAWSIFAALLIGWAIGMDVLNSLITGVLFSAAAQFGDLAESMMKRDVNTKDAGDILPGHGGILDRADSFIFTGAVAYYYFRYVYDFVHSIYLNIF